jgi:hypothetical protein
MIIMIVSIMMILISNDDEDNNATDNNEYLYTKKTLHRIRHSKSRISKKRIRFLRFVILSIRSDIMFLLGTIDSALHGFDQHGFT